MRRVIKISGILIVAIVGALVLFNYLVAAWGAFPPERYVSVPQFVAALDTDQIQHVVIYTTGEIKGSNPDNTVRIRSMVPPSYTKIYDILDQKAIDYSVTTEGFPWRAFLAGVVAALLIMGTWHLVRRTQAGR